ncbi:type II secretion system F family protein [Polaromonas sp. YR568]|uniref:type II secretion system F family protein n=1 Tax=Polaromonas sp. YR568 TaxID=1855301 RepID=UPI0031382BFA
MDPLYSIFVVLAFLAVVLFLEGLYLTWNAYRGPEARRIQQRLQALSAAGNDSIAAPLVRKRLLSDVAAIEHLLLKLPRIHAFDRFLLQSGMNLSVAEVLGIAAGLALVVGTVLALAGLPLLWSAGAAMLLIALWMGYIQRHRMQRMRVIEQQLPDALDLMARAMQAGHAFSSALRLVGTEGPQPIAQEFHTAFDEINFGIPSEKALANLASRVASGDLRFFVIAVVIQRETGGNLAEILTSIAALIRERQKLVGSIRVLSAEGRISAWILTLLPFVLAAAISLVNREFISKLWTDPLGLRMVGIALGLMLLGVWWMWRLVKIRI